MFKMSSFYKTQLFVFTLCVLLASSIRSDDFASEQRQLQIALDEKAACEENLDKVRTECEATITGQHVDLDSLETAENDLKSLLAEKDAAIAKLNASITEILEQTKILEQRVGQLTRENDIENQRYENSDEKKELEKKIQENILRKFDEV